jgi:predicted acylesterase/phospholipase RssA
MSNNTDESPKFYLGICMAGAVSAGAYTAGVMDYLLEALEAYEEVRGTPGFPKHKVEIPVMGGASAGGMTAIINAATLQQQIHHFDKPDANLLKERKDNILYHSWVDLTNEDMFSKMLETNDIDGTVASALNCAFIDHVAKRVLEPEDRASINWRKELPSFLSPRLKVFTTLSNLGGFTYDVNFNATGLVSDHPYYMQIHQDYACFELTTDKSAVVMNPGWMPLNIETGTNAPIAMQAAMATGAFPVGLKARKVTRPKEIVENNALFDKDIAPAIKVNVDPYESLNVDGGMINNEPFDKVRKVLIAVSKQDDPQVYENYNTFNSTVVMVAPFPSSKPQDIKLVDKLMNVVGLTLSAMISQMRAKPARLVDAIDNNCAGQFLIDPSREFTQTNGVKLDIQGEHAIACGALGGFSGFLNKEFRVHDYFLGRYNCKIFLRDYFTIPDEAKNTNPIFSEGYADIDQDKYRSHTKERGWQIIPIVKDDIDYNFPALKFSSGHSWPSQKWEAISRFYRPLKVRVEAIILNLVKYAPLVKFALWIGCRVILRRMLAKAALNTIKDELNNWHLIKHDEQEITNLKSQNKMATTENEVKQRILDVSLLPGTISQIDNTSALSDLGFNNSMCNDLAQRLDTYVKSVKPGTWVNNAEITASMTVQDVIDLVTQKLT